jgi:hypothetical protein
VGQRVWAGSPPPSWASHELPSTPDANNSAERSVLDVVDLSDDEGVMRLHLAQEAGRRELGSWTSGRTNSRMVGTTPELDNTILLDPAELV